MNVTPTVLLRSFTRSSARQLRGPTAVCIPIPRRFFRPPRTSIQRPSIWTSSKYSTLQAARCKSTSSVDAGSANASSTAPETRLDRDQVPAYELTFTCKVCSTRSSHRVSKQGYHHGTVLIACPGCTNRHLISDNMKIFSDTSVNIEDIMREKGDLVKRGTLGEGGDIEFWEDGSSSPRSSHFHSNSPSSEPDPAKDRLTASSDSTR